MAKVEIYSTVVCPYCVRAKRLFDNKNIEYTEIGIDKDSAKLAEMLKRADGRRSVPQIFINDVGIGGYDELASLELGGRLDEMLSE